MRLEFLAVLSISHRICQRHGLRNYSVDESIKYLLSKGECLIESINIDVLCQSSMCQSSMCQSSMFQTVASILVYLQLVTPREFLSTDVAGVRSRPGMEAHVAISVGLLGKRSAANGADVFSMTGQVELDFHRRPGMEVALRTGGR